MNFNKSSLLSISKVKILSGFIVLLFLGSCDKIEAPYIEGNPFTGNYDSNVPIRKILIEDFTGVNCPNCPRADAEIDKLEERYGNHVIAIAVHAAWFATPLSSSDPDYRTDVGLELGGNGNGSLGYFNIEQQPIGLVNRKLYNNEFKVEYQSWSNKIVDILSENKFADIGIMIENTLTSDSLLNTKITLKTINELQAKLCLSVYIIENNLVSKQKNGSETDENYEHNHVLRAGINSTWGDNIFISVPVASDTKFEKSYNYVLDNNWIVQNCEVIAFVYNTDTKEIIQAEIEAIVK